jgi:FkbM family methyltransferase
VPFRSDFATIVDAGAARGQFALFARRRYPGARIVCFEPLPEAHQVLKRLFEEDPGVELHELALAAESGAARLHVAGHDDSSSLLPIGARQEREFPGTGEVRQETVMSGRLDEVLADVARPALLKIDVQGGELDVLRGAGDLLDRFDDVFVECSFTELYEQQPLATDVLRYLFDRGLALAGVFGVQRGADGGCLQADLLLRQA